ncbi:MAG TPA: YbhN family protein [Acidimicrobiales bacterium]|nr:YbhN family protein [Acidimicrobiales bacterium]
MFLRWSWPVLRWVLSIGLLVLAVEELNGHRSELSGLGGILGQLQWWWLPLAGAAEAASLVAFTGVQYRLLGAGGLRARPRPLFGVTLASQAITNSLPGGPALAAVYGFRWYRRLGADDALAGWALVGSAVAAAFSLALVAAGGVVFATEQGATLDLIPVVAGVLVITLAIGALFLYERPLAAVVNRVLRLSHRVTGRPRGDLEAQIERLVARVTVVRLHRRQVAVIVGLGLANWLLDCSCFALSFLAVGAGIPWKALLLAYGAGQLAANLPITPGGLGAVEGSITIALAYFGGVHTAGIDAVFIYRLISFWLVLLVGWMSCGGLALGVRWGRWPRHALASIVATAPAATRAAPGQPASVQPASVQPASVQPPSERPSSDRPVLGPPAPAQAPVAADEAETDVDPSGDPGKPRP